MQRQIKSSEAHSIQVLVTKRQESQSQFGIHQSKQLIGDSSLFFSVWNKHILLRYSWKDVAYGKYSFYKAVLLSDD